MNARTRLIGYTLIILLILGMMVPTISAQSATGEIVDAARVNLRALPTATSTIVLRLGGGQIFNLVGRNADSSWVQVTTFGGASGWVSTHYVQPSVPFETLPVTANTGRLSAYVNIEFLNVRTGPGANFNIVTQLSRGDGVDLIGRNADNSWVEIQVPGGATGWVSTRYILANTLISRLPISSNTGIFPTFPQAVDSEGQTGVITARRLNVRLGPGLTFGQFTTVGQGEGVLLIGRNGQGNWLLIQMADGRTGWINAGFVRTGFSISDLPVRA